MLEFYKTIIHVLTATSAMVCGGETECRERMDVRVGMDLRWWWASEVSGRREAGWRGLMSWRMSDPVEVVKRPGKGEWGWLDAMKRTPALSGAGLAGGAALPFGMALVDGVWEKVAGSWKPIEESLDVFSKIVLLGAVFYFGVLPVFLLGHRSFHLLFVFYRPEQVPFLSALGTLGRVYIECFPGLRNARRLTLLFNATRVAVEWELLLPYDDIEDRETIGGPRERRIRYRRGKARRRDWTRKRNQRIAEYVRLVDNGKAFVDLPPVKVANVFSLTNRHEEVERYFEALLMDPKVVENKRRFLSAIEFECGYVAASYLICGTLAWFEDDWSLLHSFYLKLIRDEERDKLKESLESTKRNLNEAAFSRFYPTMLHEFNCWLLWGPSIRICTYEKCGRWNNACGHSEGVLGIQYGFGDENNSLTLLPGVVDSSSGADGGFGALLKKANDRWSMGPPAFARSVVARPVWTKVDDWAQLSSDSELRESVGRICKAQEALVSENGPHVVLDYIRDSETARIRDRFGYYSAYLWIMFLVQENDSKSAELRGSRWRRLFPIFEHANIANEEAYKTLKRSLACKAVGLLVSLAGDLRELEFVMVCSSDWSGHGDADADECLIPNMILREVEKTENESKPSIIKNGNGRGNSISHFTACDLPEIVAEYFAEMEGFDTKLELSRLQSREIDDFEKVRWLDDPRFEVYHWGKSRREISTDPKHSKVIGCFSGKTLVGWLHLSWNNVDSQNGGLKFWGLGVFATGTTDEVLESLRVGVVDLIGPLGIQNKLGFEAMARDPMERTITSLHPHFLDRPSERRMWVDECCKFLENFGGGTKKLVSTRDDKGWLRVSFGAEKTRPEGLHIKVYPIDQLPREVINCQGFAGLDKIQKILTIGNAFIAVREGSLGVGVLLGLLEKDVTLNEDQWTALARYFWFDAPPSHLISRWDAGDKCAQFQSFGDFSRVLKSKKSWVQDSRGDAC